MIRKILPVLLLAAILLTACGRDVKTSDTDGSDTVSSADTASDASAETTGLTDTDDGGNETSAETPSKPVTLPPETLPAEETTGGNSVTAVTESPVTDGGKHTHAYYVSDSLAPSCETGGYTKYTCACGAEYTETVAAAGHDFAAADCFNPEKCKVCGKLKGVSLGHSLKNGVCTRCGYGEINLGTADYEMKNLFGSPDKTFTEATSEGRVVTHVYQSGKNLKIFNYIDGTLVGAYVSGSSVTYKCGNATYSAEKESGDHITIDTCSEMEVYIFHDTLSSGEVVATYARTADFAYGLDKKTVTRNLGGENIPDYSVQEKLCAVVCNYYRALNGLAALTYSEKCADASLVHSVDMAKNNYFAHEDAEGTRVGKRLDNEGFDWKSCAENIYAAPGKNESAGIGNGIIAAHEWYVSADHRSVMLDSKYKYVGVGIARGDSSDFIYY